MQRSGPTRPIYNAMSSHAAPAGLATLPAAPRGAPQYGPQESSSAIPLRLEHPGAERGWRLWRPEEPQGGLRVVVHGVPPWSEAGPRPGQLGRVWVLGGDFVLKGGDCGQRPPCEQPRVVQRGQGCAADARRYSACPIPAGAQLGSTAPEPMQANAGQFRPSALDPAGQRRNTPSMLPAKPGVLDPAALSEWPAALTRLLLAKTWNRLVPSVDEAGEGRTWNASFVWGRAGAVGGRGVGLGKRCHL